jgi:uncharacterized protein (TIGR02145 family)
MKQLLIFISVMCSMNLSAQVTMGALESPHEAAVLDLSKVPSQKLGLLLPTVELVKLDLFNPLPGATDQQLAAKGMVVYNKRTLLAENIYPGVYVWDGTKWGWISMLDANCTEVTDVTFDLTDQMVTEGSYTDILITATPTPAPNASAVYQWYIDDVLQSSTSNTFTFPAGKTNGVYTVKVIAGNACTVTSRVATATVTVLGPLPAPSIYTVSNPNCGIEAVFEVAMPFADLADVETFMWSINDGTAVAGTGNKGYHFIVPYTTAVRTVTVYAKTNGTRASSVKSAPVTTGTLNTDHGFWLTGEVFYDIYATPYQSAPHNTLKYGTNIQRERDPNRLTSGTLTRTYIASRTYGSGTDTYTWSVSDPDDILDNFTPSTDNIQNITFKDITDDSRIKNQPGKALSVTLTCVATVNLGACNPEYTLTKLIEVRDRTTGCTLPSTIIDENHKGDADTDANGYITFQCYNLGAEPMRISEQLAYMANPSLNNKWRNTAGFLDDPNVTDNQRNGSKNSRVYGDLYQWGRKDDGHQKRNSTVFPVPVPLEDLDEATGQVSPDKTAFSQFIIGSYSSAYDWIADVSTSTSNMPKWSNTNTKMYPARWDDVGYTSSPANPVKVTANDPCPDGWRVPTIAEWRSIVLGTSGNLTGITSAGTNGTYTTWLPVAGSTDGISSWNTAPGGYIVYPTIGGSQTSPALFIPATGTRDYSTASIGVVGEAGYYWSSTVGGSTSGRSLSLYFRSNEVNTGGSGNGTARASGMSVRCVAQ